MVAIWDFLVLRFFDGILFFANLLNVKLALVIAFVV